MVPSAWNILYLSTLPSFPSELLTLLPGSGVTSPLGQGPALQICQALWHLHHCTVHVVLSLFLYLLNKPVNSLRAGIWFY